MKPTGAARAALRRADPAGILIALALLALAATIWHDVGLIERTAIYGVGPKAMPMAVAAGMALLAVANFIAAWRGDVPTPVPLALAPLLLMLGGLAALIGLVATGAGFIPAMTVLFACTAAAFGRRALLTDLVIGLMLALVVFLVFHHLLALTLPAGPLERLL